MRVVPSTKPTAGLPPRKVMLETLIRRMGLVRLSIGAFALLSASACTGLIDGSDTGTDPTLDQKEAKRLWEEKAYPVLSAACTTCHATLVGQDFLKGTDMEEVRTNLVAFAPSVVNLESPKSSRLIQKGLHDGPEMTAGQISDVLEWMLAQQDASPQPGEPGGGIVLRTKAITVTKCGVGQLLADCLPNTITLDDVPGAGLTGATITFKAPVVGSMLYINELTLNAGTTGAYLEHPLFVSVPPPPVDEEAEVIDPVADPIDRYYALKMNLMAAATEVIEGGTASFTNFPEGNQLEIHFKVITPYKMDEAGSGGGGGTTPTGGCKDLASFKANAAAAFNTSCANCHLAGNAKAAMDLAGINSADDAVLATACGQIKTRVNLTTPETSGVFIAPDPANMNHPFKFQAAQLTTFKNSVLVWINAEKVAP